MWGTNLEKAILQEANLVGADLSHARCAGAIFWDADLTEANVQLVDFSDVDLRQTLITAEQLGQAASLAGARLPADHSLRGLFRGLGRRKKPN